MAVHADERSIRCNRIVFEARFDEGYRYLDHCGEMLVNIRRHDPKWVVATANVVGTLLKNVAHEIQLSVDNGKLNLATEAELEFEAAYKRCQTLADESSTIYEIVVGTLRVPNTTRIGTRSWFSVPADSLEDAEFFVYKMTASPLLDEIVQLTSSQPRDASSTYVVEQVESGYRRRIEIAAEAVGTPDLPPPTGLPAPKWSGRVHINVDTFTRPESGHFSNPVVFINDSFLVSHRVALDLLKWGRKQLT